MESSIISEFLLGFSGDKRQAEAGVYFVADNHRGGRVNWLNTAMPAPALNLATVRFGSVKPE